MSKIVITTKGEAETSTLLDVELAFVEVDAGYDGDEEDSSDRWAGSYTHMHPQRMVGLVETVTGVHQTNTSVG